MQEKNDTIEQKSYALELRLFAGQMVLFAGSVVIKWNEVKALQFDTSNSFLKIYTDWSATGFLRTKVSEKAYECFVGLLPNADSSAQ